MDKKEILSKLMLKIVQITLQPALLQLLLFSLIMKLHVLEISGQNSAIELDSDTILASNY